MKEMFKQIPTTMNKPFSPRQKVQKPMTEIGGGYYVEKITKVLPPLRTPKQTKQAQYKEDETKQLYMKIKGIVMVENSDYIGTRLNGSIH